MHGNLGLSNRWYTNDGSISSFASPWDNNIFQGYKLGELIE